MIAEGGDERCSWHCEGDSSRTREEENCRQAALAPREVACEREQLPRKERQGGTKELHKKLDEVLTELQEA